MTIRSGVTAAFNLNLLARINRELDADFDLAAFRHEARYNSSERRIEMHLRSLRGQTVAIAPRGMLCNIRQGRNDLDGSSHSIEQTKFPLWRSAPATVATGNGSIRSGLLRKIF